MALRLKKTNLDESGMIDMTPMLDVVFIMLIFFIVTATFVKESGIEVNRPDAETSTKQNSVAILIAINEQNEIWLGGRKIDLSSVRANVERLLVENPQGSAIIQADRIANTWILVDVMDRLRQAGINKISIATNDKKL